MLECILGIKKVTIENIEYIGKFSCLLLATEAIFAVWFPKLFSQKANERLGVLQDDAEVTYYKRLRDDSVQSLNTFEPKSDTNVPYQDQKSNGYTK